jgi:nicotinate dehydrogenase subunit A
VRFVVNGRPHALAHSPGATLLHLLRNDLRLNGPKYGCGYGECGACAVLVDGIAARACVIPAAGAAGRSVTTLEGLATMDGRPAGGGLHPVQQAFVDAQAAQCGYCLNGMVMATVALLAEHPSPSDAQIRAGLAGNLCRCGAHVEIVDAVRRAAAALHSGAHRARRSADSDADPGARSTDVSADQGRR